MPAPTQPPANPADNVASGQIIIVFARWLLVLTGLVIALWSPNDSDFNATRLSLFILLALAAGNFFIHAQILLRRRPRTSLVYGASIADIVVITLIVGFFGGLGSPVFAFYFPALLALALVLPFHIVQAYLFSIMALYTFACLPQLQSESDGQVLVARLIAFAGVAVVAYLYQRIERDRRHALENSPLEPFESA